MKAYRCDRCGKLFEKYKNQGTAEFFNVTRNPNFSSDCLDLCPNCNAELQEWVKNSTEIKSGHWYRKHSWEICFTCSNCETTNASGTKYNYCPSCGARMVESEG